MRVTEPIIKRYWVFDYDYHYPGGGLYDLAGTFNTLEDAVRKAQTSIRDVVKIFDREAGVYVRDWEPVEK